MRLYPAGHGLWEKNYGRYSCFGCHIVAEDSYPSIILVSAFLSLGEALSVTGQKALTPYSLSFDNEYRLVVPLLYVGGWLARATFRTFVATAAAAEVLGLTS